MTLPVAPTPVASPPVVRVEDLRIGDLLAEGGEGRVHQLPRQPHLVFKSYRQPARRPYLEDLVRWPGTLPSPDSGSTVGAAAAWPCSVVSGARDQAVGLLMPRAPRRFAVRHKDGHNRLASLSYLTADPQHRAVAYGLQLPRAVSPERVGLVYALARLLAAFESGEPSVGHGDLSTKNILWSLQRGPEVFVIDCDNSERFGADGRPVTDAARRRAMTPNWDDPAVPRGENPSGYTDRYSLGLVFLRLLGAANFPIQARQRGGDRVEIGFPVPAGPASAVLLDAEAPVWDLCARSLSLSRVEERPPASAWLPALEELLATMGAADLVGAVRAAQGGGSPPAGAPVPRYVPAGTRPDDVIILPEKAAKKERAWSRVSPNPRYGAHPEESRAGAVGYRWAPVGTGPGPRPNPASAQPAVTQPASPRSAPMPGQSSWAAPSPQTAGGGTGTGGKPLFGGPPSTPRVWPEIRAQLVRFWGWWLALHRTLWQRATPSGTPPRRGRALISCAIADFVILVLGGALVALIVSPILQG